MIVIDTPGMLHPPKGRHLTPQQRALAQAEKEAELLVLNKIKCEDYIILCVEDTTDWKHATTRNVVTQVSVYLIQCMYMCALMSIYMYIYICCVCTIPLMYTHMPNRLANRWILTCPAPCS